MPAGTLSLGVGLRVQAGPKNPKHPCALPVQLTGSMTPSQVPLGGGGWGKGGDGVSAEGFRFRFKRQRSLENTLTFERLHQERKMAQGSCVL